MYARTSCHVELVCELQCPGRTGFGTIRHNADCARIHGRLGRSFLSIPFSENFVSRNPHYRVPELTKVIIATSIMSATFIGEMLLTINLDHQLE